MIRKLTVWALAAVFATVTAYAQQQWFTRPMPMGVSTSLSGTGFLYSGTAGMRVKAFTAPNFVGILSNNHVYGAGGPDLCPNLAAPGTIALQPSTGDLGFDPGADIQYIAAVLGGFIPIDFSSGANNVVDAAIALTTPALVKTEILNLGEPNPTLDAGIVALPGMAVTKTGRTTGTTVGTVDSINSTVNVSYGTGCGVARFVGQVVITPGTFSNPGDSGSAILRSDTMQPVGLLFAGSATRTIANQMLAVYRATGFVADGPEPVASAQQRLAQIEQRMYANNPQIRALQRLQAQAEANILQIPGVHGIGIGQVPGGSGYGLVVYVDSISSAMSSAVRARVGSVPVRFVEGEEFRAF